MNAPVWASAFRPFYLLGAAYAPLLALPWLAAWLGLLPLPDGPPLKLLHGHEFVFGFATAIILGIVITALPSWAGTEEMDAVRLKVIVALWLAGRAAFWLAPVLPGPLVAAIDCLLFPMAIAFLAPPLLRVRNRLYLLLLPILAALFLANLAYHLAVARADAALAGKALHGGIWTIVVLYVLKGGVLAPIFTGNALRETGRGDQPRFLMPLEAAALVALLCLAAGDLAGAGKAWTGSAALACLLLYGWRSLRWLGWRVADVPLLLAMHLGFAWLLLAFALKATFDLAGAGAQDAWLHAFTVGGLGMMMLGLMTRVSLRHTGRPLAMPPSMLIACAAMLLAATLRVIASHAGLGSILIAGSTLLWAAAFVLYLLQFARILVTPSLPRNGTSP